VEIIGDATILQPLASLLDRVAIFDAVHGGHGVQGSGGSAKANGELVLFMKVQRTRRSPLANLMAMLYMTI
jgi:hypothetical protein